MKGISDIKGVDKVITELSKLESMTFAGSQPYVEVDEDLLLLALNYLIELRELHFKLKAL